MSGEVDGSRTRGHVEPPLEREPLAAARFTSPPRPRGMVYRPRLLEMLQRGVDGPLTLVSAPAGTGKTVLVSSWAASGRAPGTVAWVSLDEVELQATTLWAIVVDALGRNGVDVSSEAPAVGARPRDRHFLAWLAAQIAAHPQPVVLILDCDGLLPPDAASGLDYLVRRSFGRLRLVLVTRVDPPLPLHRYRLAGTMAEVRMADLAFTTSEARALLAGNGVHLPADVMDTVVTRTQGWAAGLRLAGIALARRADQKEAVREFSGDTGTVAEYLIAEVLNAQPPDTRELLLHTSVVDILRPGLVEVLAGSRAQRDLGRLVRGNVFVEEIPESRGAYRYHPLFRELLRAQLAYESPAKVVELRRDAAKWMFDQGLLAEAVRHAVATQAWEAAANYIVDDLAIGQLLVERGPGALTDLVVNLPDDAEGVAVSLVRSALAMAGLDVEGCAEHLAHAQALLGGAGEAPWPAAELAVNVLVLVRARAVADGAVALDAASVVQRLLRQAQPGRLARHPELAALVAACRGAALLFSGQLEAARDAFAAGARAGEHPGREYPVIDCLGHLALIAAQRGQLRRAVDLAAQGVATQSRAGFATSWCPSAAEVALAWVHTETCSLAAARRHALRAAESLSLGQDPMPRAMLALVNARIRRARGDLDGALSVLAEARSGEPTLPNWLQDRLQVEEAALSIVNGQPDVAVTLVEHLSDSTEGTLVLARARLARGEALDSPVVTLSPQAAPLADRVGGWLLETSRQLSIGEEQGALRALESSLRLAAPQLIRRPYREAPDDVRRLLRKNDGLASRHGWLDEGLAAGRTPPRQRRRRDPADDELTPVGIVEPLTEKEREVLSHLDALLTTDEIAGAMFVSVNTVRTHVRNILRKLAASRRNEAVRRARELKLISG